ncbi:single-stranded DNA-binding protein [Bacillus sp. J37]|uniref:single-stranded DNA-binding protein n=1 Tax=Bacillus sp. J37 TaxID=935837 RepID=UPI0004AF55B9|nr:single-stranded DNA-binding protein [Bacillus sp. J37]
MGNKSVQILFTDDEFKGLQKKAKKKGLTVPLYIKGEILQNNEFGESYKKLIEKVDQLSSGTRFTIKLLFGTEWTMSKGVKLTLGKTFFSRVSDGTITNVEAEGKDSSNVMWYKKI